MSRKKAAPRHPLTLRYYVVGFFDLLGQQDELRRLTSLPSRDDSAAMAATREVLLRTHGAVIGMRGLIEDGARAFSSSRPVTRGMTPENRKLVRQLAKTDLRYRGFSDSMVMHLALSRPSPILAVKGIIGMIYGTGMAMLGMLAVGHPIRGGLDIGIGFEPTKDEIYGPVLARAYALESKVAGYPRVVVGEELVRYLTETATNGQPDLDDRGKAASKDIAVGCLKCLARDDDGQSFIDYLGPYFRETSPRSAVEADFINRAYGHVVRMSEECKQSRNSKLAFRYTLLRNYYDDRLPLWRQ